MMNTIIIGFGYKARQGKDTAARAIIVSRGKRNIYEINNSLVSTTGIDVRRYSFATALKHEVERVARAMGGIEDLCALANLASNGFVTYDPNSDMTDPDCPSGKQRTLLQWYGSDFRRVIKRDYWVKALSMEIKYHAPEVALITDVRFPNEAAWIKDHNGFMVNVIRLGYVSDIPFHGSEMALNGYEFDYEIVAPDGNIAVLNSRAISIFDSIMHTVKEV